MTINQEPIGINQSIRLWKVSSILLAVLLVGCFVWGYGNKGKVNNAVAESRRISEALTSMKNAFGVTPIPPDHEEDVENERVSRKTMKFGTVELSLGMTKEEVFERLEPQFRLSMLEPDFTRPEQQFWGDCPDRK